MACQHDNCPPQGCFNSAMFCEHANEVPAVCTCKSDCYCKSHTCLNINLKEFIQQFPKCLCGHLIQMHSPHCINCFCPTFELATTMNKGKKNDDGKLRFSLIAPNFLAEFIKGLMVGAKQYGDFNWMKVDNHRERYYNALMRHVTAWWNGEQIDKESGVHHLALAANNLMFLFERGE